MQRRIMLAAAGAALALAPAAQAAPVANDHGLIDLPATCDGVEGTVTHTNGSSFYFGGTHYVLRSISGSIEGTVVFSKTYGGGGGETITCTATETGDDGTSVDLTVTAFAP
jgi:hypothetical protein